MKQGLLLLLVVLPAAVYGGVASYSVVGCSEAQRSEVALRLSIAEAAASRTLFYLRWGCRGAAFSDWFGNSSAIELVLRRLGNVQLLFRSGPFTLRCEAACSIGRLAYVDFPVPDPDSTIHLCPGFFRQRDLAAQLLVHEATHFPLQPDGARGTIDYSYGQEATRALAVSHPQRSASNADSYAYAALDPRSFACFPDLSGDGCVQLDDLALLLVAWQLYGLDRLAALLVRWRRCVIY